MDIPKLSIEKGSILGLSGANGSGKSTLLKLLAFAMSPTQGNIRFNGQIEKPLSPTIRSRVTLLTQTPYLLKRSVFENITYGLKLRKDKDNIPNRVKAAMASVGLEFNAFENRKWHELSGGEAQRVAMAARLILKPQALLLDEPVASVDASSAQLIRQASINARNHWGCTLVVVSHDLSWLHEISDQRISMARGRIFTTGEELIIPGPYETDDQGNGFKDIGTGEVLRLSQGSPGKVSDGTAVIQKDKITLAGLKNPSDTRVNQVSIQVTQMMLEKNPAIS